MTKKGKWCIFSCISYLASNCHLCIKNTFCIYSICEHDAASLSNQSRVPIIYSTDMARFLFVVIKHFHAGLSCWWPDYNKPGFDWMMWVTLWAKFEKIKPRCNFFFFFTIFTKNVHLALNAVYLDVSKLIFISATKRIHHNMKHVCLCSIYPGTPEHILI